MHAPGWQGGPGVRGAPAAGASLLAYPRGVGYGACHWKRGSGGRLPRQHAAGGDGARGGTLAATAAGVRDGWPAGGAGCGRGRSGRGVGAAGRGARRRARGGGGGGRITPRARSAHVQQQRRARAEQQRARVCVLIHGTCMVARGHVAHAAKVAAAKRHAALLVAARHVVPIHHHAAADGAPRLVQPHGRQRRQLPRRANIAVGPAAVRRPLEPARRRARSVAARWRLPERPCRVQHAPAVAPARLHARGAKVLRPPKAQRRAERRGLQRGGRRAQQRGRAGVPLGDLLRERDARRGRVVEDLARKSVQQADLVTGG